MNQLDEAIAKAQAARRSYDLAIAHSVARWDVIASDLTAAANAVREADASLVGLRQQLLDRAEDADCHAERQKARARDSVRAAIAAMPSFVEAK